MRPIGHAEITAVTDVSETTRGRTLRIAAWVLSILALYLSATGWFMVFGLVASIPAIVLARVAHARGPCIVGIAALVAALAWITIDWVIA